MKEEEWEEMGGQTGEDERWGEGQNETDKT